MSKEFHVFTDIQPSHEQAFVFEVNRNDEDDTIEIGELWLITTQKFGELRTRVHLNSMIGQMVSTKGGNVDEQNIPTIVEMFEDLLPEEKIEEIKRDTMNETERLLQASEIIAGLSEESINDMLKSFREKGL